jgi:cytochrome c-type biogenesis protein
MTLALHVSTSHSQNQAPDFTLKDLNGDHFSLSDFRGRTVLLDFFATWCTACIQEIPHLKTLIKNYPNSTLVVISISVDFPNVDDSVIRSFVRDHGITWTVARDTVGVAYKYEVFDIPTQIFVDQEGKMRSRLIGLTESDVLQSKIQLIIPEFTIPAMTMVLALTATSIVFRKRR